MDKQYIFDNIADFSAEQIVEFIKQGIVTQEELENPDNTYGDYLAEVRLRVRDLLENVEPRDWKHAQDLNTIESYNQYIKSYPNGAHKAEAEATIASLEDAVWAQVCSTNTIEAYKGYLIEFSRGKYRDDARGAIRKLQESEILQEEANVWNSVDKSSIDALQRFVNEKPNSTYVAKAKSQIDELKKQEAHREEIAEWDKVDKESLADLRSFLSNYPNGMKTAEARRLINELTIIDDIGIIDLTNKINAAQTQIEVLQLIQNALSNNKVSVDEVLDLIEDDHNVCSSSVIKQLIDDGNITWEDLFALDIDKAFITQLTRPNNTESFGLSDREWSKERNSTEIYFWGVPSSGKTCALGAILSVAGGGEVVSSMRQDPNCQGFDYMNRLPQCFKLSGEVTVLPAGTPTLATYEMGFDLVDKKYKTHPVTCIDFAGELIECMYKKYAGIPLTEDQDEALHVLTKFLGGKDENGKSIGNRTKNRKIHFFVVEYGAESKLHKGLPQMTYLNSTIEYIRQTGIFNTNTDAVFLIVTKVDKIKAQSEEERIRLLTQHVETNYRAFYNGLDLICRENQINGGRVQVLPFSLGEVCFQDFCRLDAKYAAEIVKIILKRVPHTAGWFTRIFGN